MSAFFSMFVFFTVLGLFVGLVGYWRDLRRWERFRAQVREECREMQRILDDEIPQGDLGIQRQRGRKSC